MKLKNFMNELKKIECRGPREQRYSISIIINGIEINQMFYTKEHAKLYWRTYFK